MGDAASASSSAISAPTLERAARDDGDLAGRAARGEQARDLGGDQLGLGALVAALEQRDRVAGPARVGSAVLEQRALQAVQRRAAS